MNSTISLYVLALIPSVTRHSVRWKCRFGNKALNDLWNTAFTFFLPVVPWTLTGFVLLAKVLLNKEVISCANSSILKIVKSLCKKLKSTRLAAITNCQLVISIQLSHLSWLQSAPCNLTIHNSS